MGYYLQALIGSQPQMESHVSDFRNVRVVSLPQAFALIPVTNDLYLEIGAGKTAQRFEKLSSQVEAWVQRVSYSGPVAYVEAEFFGGLGGQSAIVWSAGRRKIGPIHGKNAINQALRFLGVQIEGAHDEFDAINLGRHRETDDWTT